MPEVLILLTFSNVWYDNAVTSAACTIHALPDSISPGYIPVKLAGIPASSVTVDNGSADTWTCFRSVFQCLAHITWLSPPSYR